MSVAPAVEFKGQASLAQPDYLPARMINEFAYCPRLFHYEQVLGVFVHNEHTVEGAAKHKRVDKEGKGAPKPGDKTEEPVVVSSITLSSEEHRVIAKLDLAEFKDGRATPIDYKKGRPRKTDDGIEAWPSDEVQMAVQALVLRDNGYECDEGILFYHQTRQRVRVTFSDKVIDNALETIRGAWEAVTNTRLPPPLADSPKCPGCSLVGVCLPDETYRYQAISARDPSNQFSLFDSDGATGKKKPKKETRLLVAPRVDLKPLYLNTQGLRVGKSWNVLKVKQKAKVIQEVRINDICQVNLFGNIQITTQAVQSLCQAEKPVCYFSQGGWFYGITTGLNTKNVVLRKAQIVLADEDWFSLRVSRAIVAGKIKNQRTMLMRNHIEPPTIDIRQMKRAVGWAENAASTEELLGLEGYAAKLYFGNFSGMLKRDGTHNENTEFKFDFTRRNRRPPRDPINALLSYGYSLLTKDLTIASYAVGLDPMIGYYHQPRHGRPALALDIMEPLRPLVVDSAVLSAVNTGMVTSKHFVEAGKAVSMNPAGRRAFLRAYEGRMDQLVTHPQLGYRVTYRRLLEIQARLLGKTLDGELDSYPVFITR